MFLLLLFVCLLTLLLWFLRWYVNVRYFENALKGIPGPKPLPFIGNALELADTKTLLPKLMGYMNTYKRNFKFYVGCQPYFVIYDPKDLETIFTSATIITKSEVYDIVHNWIGLGLLTSKGNRWRKHRKIITPAFHFQILEQFVEIFNTNSDILISILKTKSKNGSFDIYPYISRCTLDVICETAMGTSINAQKDLESEYVKHVHILLEMFALKTTSPIHSNKFLYPFTRTYWKERHALMVVHDYTRSVINKRKAEYTAMPKDQMVEEDAFGRKRKQAFLDLLLEYSSKDSSFTEDDIQQEVDTFMLAGYETTATSIAFALYALAANPDVQKKAYAELEKIFADDPDRYPTYGDLQEMKYLEMVIKEALRMYTTIPLLGRALDEDTDWNGMLLPKGLMITIFLYGVSNSPAFYEEPEKFNPDRFTVEKCQERNPFLYVPFSAGVRNCIGQRFALLEMKCILSKVLRTFELLPALPHHKMVLKNEVSLKSDNGVIVKLRNRRGK